MKKVLAVAAVLGVLARRFGPKMPAIDWEKRLEAMPDNAPPKWMFRNITAIRGEHRPDPATAGVRPVRTGPAGSAA